jgi:AcrR family transcriptional regulator
LLGPRRLDSGYGTSVREVCRRLGVSHNLVHELRLEGLAWYAAIEHGSGRWRARPLRLRPPPATFDRLWAILLRRVEVTAERPALIASHHRRRAREASYVERYILRPTVADVVLRLVANGRAPGPAGHAAPSSGRAGAWSACRRWPAHFPEQDDSVT